MTDRELIVDPPRESGRFVPGHSYSPSTQFRPGQQASPETQVQPGQRLSPRTEFKPGRPAHNKLPVGSVTIRNRSGVRRAFVKVGEPNKWRERAKVVWEGHHGRRLPRGLVIHHIDRDPLNDDPSNLVALTRRQHALEHLDEVQAAGFGSEEALAAARAARTRRAG